MKNFPIDTFRDAAILANRIDAAEESAKGGTEA